MYAEFIKFSFRVNPENTIPFDALEEDVARVRPDESNAVFLLEFPGFREQLGSERCQCLVYINIVISVQVEISALKALKFSTLDNILFIDVSGHVDINSVTECNSVYRIYISVHNDVQF